jgi:hypothetical protein
MRDDIAHAKRARRSILIQSIDGDDASYPTHGSRGSSEQGKCHGFSIKAAVFAVNAPS